MERTYATRDVWFEDRRDAGQALADALKERQVKCDAVLGLIRGGVPVAFEVAQALQIPLDILAVKKLRAPISEELREKAQQLALAAHRALQLRGYSRTDMILTEEGDLYILETNTIPGMTPTSLLPQAAAVYGLDFPALLERLIELALQ